MAEPTFTFKMRGMPDLNLIALKSQEFFDHALVPHKSSLLYL